MPCMAVGSLLVHEMGHLIAAYFLETEVSRSKSGLGAVARLKAWHLNLGQRLSSPCRAFKRLACRFGCLGHLGYTGYSSLVPAFFA